MLKTRYNHFVKFIREDLWFLNLTTFSPFKRFVYSGLKLFLIVSQGWKRHNCGQNAYGLTFITLIAVVPLLALIFALAKGFNIDELLQRSMDNYVNTFPIQVQSVIKQITMLVSDTDFTTVGIIGFIVLFSTIIVALGTIEKSFNAIWGVREHRQFLHKLRDYLVVVLVVPSLFVVSSAMIAVVSNDYLTALLSGLLGKFYAIYELLLGMGGMIGIIATFSFIYGFLPNTSVRLSSAIIGGLIAGLVWYVVQWIYINFQVGVASYSVLYGVFATLPIFVFWLYMNWIVVLLGAEVSSSIQNFGTHLSDRITESISPATYLRIACTIVDDICRSFNDGTGPWRLELFQRTNNIPVHVLNDILTQLSKNRVIIASDSSYLPAKNPDKINVATVYGAIFGQCDERILSLLIKSQNQKMILEKLGEEEAFLRDRLSSLLFKP